MIATRVSCSRLRWLREAFELIEGNAVEDLTSDGFVLAETTADEDVITFHAFSSDFHFRAQQSDVTDVMLRAGVRATGKMNVDRVVEREFLFQVSGEFESV